MNLTLNLDAREKKKNGPREIFLTVTTFLLICLFMYAGVSKLLEYSVFKFQLMKSPLIYKYASALAYLLPLSEIAIALMLVTEKYRLWGYYLSYFLMLVFTIYLLYMTNYSYYIPCSCGGILGNLSWDVHIYFNLFFVIIAALAIVWYKLPQNENL